MVLVVLLILVLVLVVSVVVILKQPTKQNQKVYASWLPQ
jgi:hypothetical protein